MSGRGWRKKDGPELELGRVISPGVPEGPSVQWTRGVLSFTESGVTWSLA